MPDSAAAETMRRHAASPSATALAKYGSTSRVGIDGSLAYASTIRFRNCARMMQPPRQIVAMAPLSMVQSYCLAPAMMMSKPCA